MNDNDQIPFEYPKKLDELGLLDPNTPYSQEAFAADYEFTQWKLRVALASTNDPKLILELNKALMNSHIVV